MTDFEKFELINSTESLEALKEAIIKIGGLKAEIQGRTRVWPVSRILEGIETAKNYFNGTSYPYGLNSVTRNFGIRQQLLYLLLAEQRSSTSGSSGTAGISGSSGFSGTTRIVAKTTK